MNFRFCTTIEPISVHSRESGNPGPRTRPKSWVPASAGTNGPKRRLKTSSRSSDCPQENAAPGNLARLNISGLTADADFLLDHLVGARQQCRWQIETQRPG